MSNRPYSEVWYRIEVEMYDDWNAESRETFDTIEAARRVIKARAEANPTAPHRRRIVRITTIEEVVPED